MASPATSDQKTMPPPPSVPTREDAVEYKKDGTVSRMRSHRGNVPQLPQTKLCPYCPAKFTRTTHLNRHLRNHTNERLYRCEVCGAQFTRSDLLARHKRSCGESHPISRSRKRSCQACTSLKVKCDLRQPCSKCRARGRDCVYITDDEGQREGVVGSSSGDRVPDSRPWGPLVRLDASAGFDPSTLGRGGSDAFASAFPELSLIEEASNAISQPLSEANLASFVGGAPRVHQGAMSLPTIDASTDITTSSFPLGGPNHAFFGASEIAGHSRGLPSFSPTMFEPFFRDVFSIKEETSQQNDQSAAPLLHAPDTGMLVDGFGPSDFTQTSANGMQLFDVNQNRSLASDLMTNVYYDNTQMPHFTQDNTPAPAVSSSLPVPLSVGVPTHQPVYAPNLAHDLSKPPLYSQQDFQWSLPLSRSVDDTPPEPTTEELQQYLCIFLTAFLPQIPIVHTPTLRVELKPPMIVRAMQACGAIFVKTPVAQAFVEKMLAKSRDMVHEFAKPSPEPKHQIHVIMTLLLLQTIGLFHQDPQQRASSNIYHGMLVLMVRQNRLIEHTATWEPKAFPPNGPDGLETTWRDWAMHESLKRMVCLVYCHDQAHRIYFSLPPSFSPEEFATFLPCDDALWGAQTALEWSQLLLSPSPYGSIDERLRGVPMLCAFAAVGLEGPNMTATLSASPTPPDQFRAVSPFGHFILLQSLLGELFRRCSGSGSPSASPNPEGEEQVNEHVYAMQLALHRWLQMWLKTPGAVLNGNSPGETDTDEKAKRRFMADPLPFYWLAQLLLLAFQEGLPPFRSRELPAASPTRPSDSPNAQVLLDPSPFAPPSSAASPFSASPFAPSPFSTSSFSSDSSPVMSSTPPPAYRSPSGGPAQPPGKYSPGGAPQAAGSTATPDAAQFRLVKQWLHYIRMFLRRSQGSPTVVWDELMKIRLCGWQSDASGEQQHGDGSKKDVADGDSGSWLEGDGLLGFFEEKCRI